MAFVDRLAMLFEVLLLERKAVRAIRADPHLARLVESFVVLLPISSPLKGYMRLANYASESFDFDNGSRVAHVHRCG